MFLIIDSTVNDRWQQHSAAAAVETATRAILVLEKEEGKIDN